MARDFEGDPGGHSCQGFPILALDVRIVLLPFPVRYLTPNARAEKIDFRQ